jgi:hypothetical protein
MRPLLAGCAVLSLALAACAANSPHWEKPGAAASAVHEDSEQCRTRARQEAPLPQFPRETAATTTQSRTFDEQRKLNETEFFQKCMREKGYRAAR